MRHATDAPTRALVYVRKSTPDPRNPERSRSTLEQEADCRRWCEERGWEVAAVVMDDGISASKYAKRAREGWPKVLAMLERREVAALVTWETSRAVRDLGDYARLRDVLQASGAVWLASGAVVDLGLAGGVAAVVDEHYSRETRERILRTVRANAAAGRPHGRRVFGYERTYDPTTGALTGERPHPEEAPVVTEIVNRVARGESMLGLARELNERGLRTSTGSAWNASTVRRTARNLHYAGIRVHLGEESPGTWPAIVPEALVRAAIAHTDGNKLSRATPSSVPVHLLSGLARCGKCGGKMLRGHNYAYRSRAAGIIDKDKKVHTYWCRDGVGHLAVRKEPVDAIVLAAVAGYLARADVGAMIAATEAAEPSAELQEVRALRARLDEAVAAFTAGELTAGTLAKVEADLLPRIAAAEASVRRTTLPPVVVEALGHDFLTLPLAEQRAVIDAVATVTILPTKRSKVFDPERVSIAWKV